MNIFNKIIGLIIGIFIFPFFTFASNANISVSKQTLDANSNFKLTVKMTGESGSFSFINFEGVDNFDIIGESQSSSIRTINGKTTSELFLILTLSPRKSGDFTLGPISITDGINTFKTNKIKIKITGEKFFVNQVKPQKNKNKKPIKDKKIEAPKKIEKIEDFEKNIVKKEFGNNNEKYFLIFGLLILSLIFTNKNYLNKQNGK